MKKPISELLPFLYEHNAKMFAIDMAHKVLQNFDSLYPNIKSQQEKNKAKQILMLEMITKLCAYAEDLAAISLAILKGGDLGANLISYGPNEIHDFYKKLDTKNLEYFSKILGYPPLSTRKDRELTTLRESCEIARNKIIEIKKYFNDYWDLYNAYKHGSRLFLGESKVRIKGKVIEGYGFYYFKRARPTNLKFKILQYEIIRRLYSLASFVQLLIQSIIKNYLSKGKKPLIVFKPKNSP